MTILNPISSTNQLLPAASNQQTTPVERQLDLSLHQMVRATVVEAGLDRVLLEMNHRQYQAQTDLQLQVGQKLTLQVLQAHPQLELRVLSDPVSDKLNQLLPLLSRPYDWSRLLDNLQRQPLPKNLPPEVPQVLNQLRQLLQPGERVPKELDAAFSKITDQLRQFAPAATAVARATTAVQVQPGEASVFVSRTPDQAPPPQLLPLVKNLLFQLAQQPQKPGQLLPQEWLGQTQKLLAPLLQKPELSQLIPPAQLGELNLQLGRLLQQPQLPVQMHAAVEKLLVQIITRQPRVIPQPNRAQQAQQPQQLPGAESFQPKTAVAPVVPQQNRTLPPAYQPQSSQPQSFQPQTSQVQSSQPVTGPQLAKAPAGQSEMLQGRPVSELPGLVHEPLPGVRTAPGAAVQVPEITAGGDKIMTLLQQLQPQQKGLPPELAGKLEGLVQQLRQLPQRQQVPVQLLPALELVSGQFMELLQLKALPPRGELLGVLSQLFGFHLEAELLNGKQKAALASLKLQLLAMQGEGSEELKEPLQRLELFQLCRAKLAEENVQFVPLPFSELEEGYLLAEHGPGTEDDDEAAAPLQMSLSLRVSALGNLQIDMLYDQQGLHLRIACEDNEKMTYLQAGATELKESITSLPLQGVSFSADAQQPSRRLIEHLLPEALGMLDARI